MAELKMSAQYILRDAALRAAPQDEAAEVMRRVDPHGEEQAQPASRTMRPQRDTPALRPFSDLLLIPRFCDRAACRRAGKCRGNAERCLSLYADCVPLEAREFIVDLMTSRELGYSFEEAMRRNTEGAKDFAAWVSPVMAQGNTDAKAR